MKRAALTALCFLLICTAAWCASDDSRWDKVPAKDHARTNPLVASAETIDAGALVYQEHCAQCHRANAEGDSKHPSLRDEALQNRSDGDIDWFLRQGDL